MLSLSPTSTLSCEFLITQASENIRHTMVRLLLSTTEFDALSLGFQQRGFSTKKTWANPKDYKLDIPSK